MWHTMQLRGQKVKNTRSTIATDQATSAVEMQRNTKDFVDPNLKVYCDEFWQSFTLCEGKKLFIMNIVSENSL